MTTKKTGLVFTGGGLRGICAQAAALSVLEEHNCRFEAMIGTSAGAIVGGLYASGLSAKEIGERISTATKADFLDPPSNFTIAREIVLRQLKGLTGYYKGRALLQWLKNNLGDKQIEDCDPPFYLTVTNVSRGIPQVIDKGPLADFVRASASMPVIYRLHEIDGEYYADGGASNNVPVDELVKKVPDLEQILVLTALKVIPNPPPPPPNNRFLKRRWTPFRAVGRIVEAISEGVEGDNLNTSGLPLEVLRVRTPDVDLDEPEKIQDCFAKARQNVQEQIASGAIRFADIPKRA